MTTISRAVGWATACVFAVSTPCFAQQKAPTIWGDAIMPQPFDRQAFYEVRVPEWVQGTIGCGYALSVMDHAQRAEAVKHGVSLSEMGFVDPFYAYYDSKLLERPTRSSGSMKPTAARRSCRPSPTPISGRRPIIAWPSANPT